MFVIDASLVRRYDDYTAEGELVRQVLDNVLDACVPIAVSRSMDVEYTEHMKTGATEWYLNMTLAGLVVRNESGCGKNEELLHAKLSKSMIRDKSREEAVRKDIRLMAVALTHECPIMSLDDAMRSCASQGELVREVGAVYWFNPIKTLPDGNTFDILNVNLPEQCKLSHRVKPRSLLRRERDKKKVVAKRQRNKRD